MVININKKLFLAINIDYSNPRNKYNKNIEKWNGT